MFFSRATENFQITPFFLQFFSIFGRKSTAFRISHLGSQNEQMQRQLAESQRAAQLEFNSRLDEEAALEEAIKRSLQH